MTTNDRSRRDAHPHRPGTGRILIRPIAILAGSLLALSIAGPVAADAVLVTSSPEDEAVVTTPPVSVTLTFDEGLDQAKSSFKLVRDGATIGTGRVGAANASVITLDGLSLVPGGYEIRWAAGSTDGHLIRGTLTFTVADPTPVPATPEPTTVSTGPPAATPPATATATPTGMPGPTSSPGESTPATTATTATDALVPIVVGLVALAVVGTLIRQRSRKA